MDTGEAGGLDDREVIGALRGAGDAADVGKQIGRDRLGQGAVEDDVRDHQAPAGAQDADDLTEHDGFV
ncbi:MAG: hypothetical protein DMF51_16765, partial [Acidobacteria bacterium]